MATFLIEISPTEWRRVTNPGDTGTSWKKTGGPVMVCQTDQESDLFLPTSNTNVSLGRSKRVPLDIDSGDVLNLSPLSDDHVFYALSILNTEKIVVDAPTKSIYQKETIEQIIRIEADGGTVIDADWMDIVIGLMKAQGIYGDAKFVGDANMGIKKDGLGAVATLYDISGNNNDDTQSIGASQLIWTPNQQNSHAVLVADGVDDYLQTFDSETVPLGFQNIGNNNDFSIIIGINGTDSGTGGATGWRPNTVLTELRTEQAAGSKIAFCLGITDNHIELGRASNYTTTSEREQGTVNIADSTTHLITSIVTDDVVDFYVDSALDVQRTYTTDTGDHSVGTTTSNMVTALRSKDDGTVDTTNAFAGNILFKYIFNIGLTTTQRQAMETLKDNYYEMY